MANKGFGLQDTIDYIFAWETDSEIDDCESDCDSVSDSLYSQGSHGHGKTLKILEKNFPGKS